MSLYFCLLGDATEEQELTHLDLLNGMDVGLPRFFQARKQLEGIGLLRSYQKDDSEFGKMLLYELFEPLHPQAFFREQLTAFLLLSKVGEQKFQQLIRRFRPKMISTEGYQEVTQKFTEVYSWTEAEFGRQETTLDHVSGTFSTSNENLPQLDSSKLDWAFLLDLSEKNLLLQRHLQMN